MPPTIQTSTNIASDSTLPATIDGVRKIPTPSTRPTMIVMASKTDRMPCGLGWFGSVIPVIPCLGRMERNGLAN